MLTWVLGMWFVVRPLGNYLARCADAKAAIGPIEEDRLTAAFEILGRERVAHGLTATGHGWNDCFLAFATEGEPYGLRPGLRKGWRTNPKAGLPVDMTQALVRAWDRKEGAFRALASEWLAERQKLTIPSETLHAAAPSLRARLPALSQRGA
jgi:hypothetical protein